eukprot:1968983-Karenia_brevis.AAC.1
MGRTEGQVRHRLRTSTRSLGPSPRLKPKHSQVNATTVRSKVTWRKDCRKKKADEAAGKSVDEGSKKRKISSLETVELAEVMKEALTRAIGSLAE